MTESYEINRLDIKDFGDRLEYYEDIKKSKFVGDEAEKVDYSGFEYFVNLSKIFFCSFNIFDLGSLIDMKT